MSLKKEMHAYYWATLDRSAFEKEIRSQWLVEKVTQMSCVHDV